MITEQLFNTIHNQIEKRTVSGWLRGPNVKNSKQRLGLPSNYKAELHYWNSTCIVRVVYLNDKVFVYAEREKTILANSTHRYADQSFFDNVIRDVMEFRELVLS